MNDYIPIILTLVVSFIGVASKTRDPGNKKFTATGKVLVFVAVATFALSVSSIWQNAATARIFRLERAKHTVFALKDVNDAIRPIHIAFETIHSQIPGSSIKSFSSARSPEGLKGFSYLLEEANLRRIKDVTLNTEIKGQGQIGKLLARAFNESMSELTKSHGAFKYAPTIDPDFSFLVGKLVEQLSFIAMHISHLGETRKEATLEKALAPVLTEELQRTIKSCLWHYSKKSHKALRISAVLEAESADFVTEILSENGN